MFCIEGGDVCRRVSCILGSQVLLRGLCIAGTSQTSMEELFDVGRGDVESRCCELGCNVERCAV